MFYLCISKCKISRGIYSSWMLYRGRGLYIFRDLGQNFCTLETWWGISTFSLKINLCQVIFYCFKNIYPCKTAKLLQNESTFLRIKAQIFQIDWNSFLIIKILAIWLKFLQITNYKMSQFNTKFWKIKIKLGKKNCTWKKLVGK